MSTVGGGGRWKGRCAPALPSISSPDATTRAKVARRMLARRPFAHFASSVDELASRHVKKIFAAAPPVAPNRAWAMLRSVRK